ncbi:MAG: CHASE3 domain-containing protein, partial [Pseudomonadota bacterium]
MTRTLNRIAYKAKGSLDRRSSMGSARLLLITVLLLGAMLAGSSWFARAATSEQRLAEAWQEHTFAVLETLADIRVATLSIRRGERGYLLTGDENYLQP